MREYNWDKNMYRETGILLNDPKHLLDRKHMLSCFMQQLLLLVSGGTGGLYNFFLGIVSPGFLSI